jgi:ATP-dependent HslUV protease subunit HslV
MTTIVSLRKNNKVYIGGDGQVTLGNTIIKSDARKIRKINGNKVLIGFAGATADAFTLMDLFEQQFKSNNNNIDNAVISFTKIWRTDKMLRKLEAFLIVADCKKSFIISGSGDVIQKKDDLLAIGSGGNYAYSAAKALLENTDLDGEEIIKKSLSIASEICIYTNNEQIIESIEY